MTDLAGRIGRRITLHDLHVLLAVVAAGSMGKAASRLHTSQPAISRTIAELERSLGVPLLERHRDGVIATPYGKALTRCGSEVFDDLRRGVMRIEALLDPTRGEVTVGCNPVLAASFVAAAVEAVLRKHPGISFRLAVGPTESLCRQLSERSVDLVVTRMPPEGAPEPPLVAEHLFDDAFVVAAAATNPLARRRKLTLRDLANQAWVLPPPESLLGTVTREAFVADGIRPPPTAVVAVPLDVRLSLLATGRFVTVLPVSALHLPRRRPDIRALPVPLHASAPIVLLAINGRNLPPAAETFLTAARTLARSLAKQREG